jgi:hypothetical protein
MVTKQKAYVELVAEAEQAVSGVKDAELRRVAFERILDDLLSGGRSGSMGDSARPREAAPKAASPSKKVERGRRSPPRRGGPQAYVEGLIADQFFKKQKTISEVKAELGNRGHHIALTSLSGPLQKLCQKKILRRQKIDGKGGKKTFGYSNW